MLDTDRGVVEADKVVVATGPFQVPAVPTVASGLAPDVVQMHSADYRNPSQLPPGAVLVVGAGNSGVQIAAELAATRQVTLAVGARVPSLPQRVARQDIFTWLTRSRAIGISVDTPLGRRLSRRDVLVGSWLSDLRGAGVDLRSRVLAAEGAVVTLQGAHRIQPASIIWATGYRPDFTWLPLAALSTVESMDVVCDGFVDERVVRS